MRKEAMYLKIFWAIFLAAALTPCMSAQQQPLSPREQLKRYLTQLQASPSDDALRTKIIQLALQLQPPPAIPPEADELAGRAQYIFEHANSPDDLVKAADAFEKVALVAPWLPDYYFDAAVAYEKANHPADALKDYKLSILAYPQDSPDAKKVREKIGALSYVLEQQQEQTRQAEAQREAAAQAEREAEAEREAQRRFDGRYACRIFGSGKNHFEIELLVDIQDGQVTTGSILLNAHGFRPAESDVGQYGRGYSVALSGHNYHIERDHGNAHLTLDGRVSDDGTSITEHYTDVYPSETDAQSHVYKRQGMSSSGVALCN